MAQNRMAETYSRYAAFLSRMSGTDFFEFFENSMLSSPMSIKFYERYMERRIDSRWLEAIEAAIIPLDNLIRNPRRFIKREEDVVPIEIARDIGPESVRHLAQHTNMIEAIEDGNVIPGRILNIVKEESFDTYENRFIYTLLKQIQYFLDKRMAVMMQGAKNDDIFDYSIDGNCELGREQVKYHLELEYTSPHVEVDENEEKLIRADVTGMTSLERVERLRKILYSFQGSLFCKNMVNTAPVRPPLVMTNALKKNPDFQECVKLWGFINSYSELGYSVEYVERYRNPSRDDIREMVSVIMLQYLLMKGQSGRVSDTADYLERRTEIAPNIIHRYFEQIASTFDITVDEVRLVFEKEVKRDERKKQAVQASTRAIFDRAVALEKKKLDDAMLAERVARIERFIGAARSASDELFDIREAERLRREEEERLRREEEARKRAEFNALRRQKYAERRAAELEAKRKAEEEARRLAEEEARRKAEEEERLRAEEAERQRLELIARMKAEEEARKKAEEEARLAEEARIAAREAEIKAQEEILRQAEEEARAAEEERIRAQENLRRTQEAAREADAKRRQALEEIRAIRRKYDGMSRKKKKKAQKRDGVYEKIGKQGTGGGDRK